MHYLNNCEKDTSLVGHNFGIELASDFFQQPLDFREEASAISFELEQRLLESRLRQQKLQSEQDSKWLQREENALKNR